MSSPSMKRVVDDMNTEVPVDTSRQRKFFPRLKTLLSDEYEDFLRQVIEIVEANQCAAFPMATADTPWADTFEAIYKTVASEYALPQGKNRLHKFKEKMVELWSAMHGEVTLGVKSDAHPIYRMALKQWKLHQSIMKDKSKPPPMAATLQGGGREETGGGAGGESDNEEGPRPRKKSRSSTNELRRSAGGMAGGEPRGSDLVGGGLHDGSISMVLTQQPHHHHHHNQHSNQSGVVTMPTEMMESWLRSLSRLENMLTASGLLPQKLPSPLYELHRLKTQMPEADFDSKVRPHYEQEIGRHLTQVTAQCRTSSQPGYLPHLLEGLDVLRQLPQSATVKKSIDYTHKTVLTKYLRLVARDSEPHLTAAAAANGGRDKAQQQQQQQQQQHHHDIPAMAAPSVMDSVGTAGGGGPSLGVQGDDADDEAIKEVTVL